MTGYQEIKKQILPLIKGSPFVLVCLVTAIIIAKRVIIYTPEQYSAMAKIRLDDQKVGLSNNNLYTDFDIFSTENKIDAEIEILKSPLILGMAIDSLNLNYSLYRVGKIRSTLLYDNTPLEITIQDSLGILSDRRIIVTVTSDSTFTMTDKGVPYECTFNSDCQVGGAVVKIDKKPNSKWQLEGKYEIVFHSKLAMIKQIQSNLTIVDTDKGVAVVRVVIKDEHPVRAALIVNHICKAYIQDYVNTRSNAAKQTLGFIEEEIAKIASKLSSTEDKIEKYKDNNYIVNTRQQTETGLREISKLKLSLVNLEMNEKAMLELEEYVRNGDYFDETAINFGFGDLLMTELVKKLKLWQDEKIDLLVKYTPNHEKVMAAEDKIVEIKRYIKEAIARNKKEIITKKEEIRKSLEIISTQFEGLPTKEKRMMIMNRDFNIHESVFYFLSQKKIEASIAGAAYISFHRIIEPAHPPKKPVSPNKTLILFVSGVLSLFISIALIYLRQFMSAKIVSREDIEKRSMLPVMGVLRKNAQGNDGVSIAKNIFLKKGKKKALVICVTSTLSGEGKTFLSNTLFDGFKKIGLNATLIDLNQNDETSLPDIENGLSEKLSISINHPIDEVTNFIKLLKLKSQVIIIDAPSAAITIDSVQFMKLSNLCLYVSRSKFTGIVHASHADVIAEEFEIKNIQHVINDVHKASNYSGNYVGRTFMAGKRKSGIIEAIKSYYRLYFT